MSFIWDTCSVIQLIKESKPPLLLKGFVLKSQEEELSKLNPKFNKFLNWLDCPVKKPDDALLYMAKKGYTVITLDKILIKRIVKSNSRVKHYRTFFQDFNSM